MRTELLALGVFGAPSRLRERIETLVSRSSAHSRCSRLFCGLFAAALIAFALASPFTPRWIAFAQQPAFEVASVKPGDPHPNIIDSDVQPGGRFYATNLTLKELIEWAYALPSHLISGGPGWIDSDRFTIEAKPDSAIAVPPGPAGIAQVKLMTQSLLAERFKLSIHRETKEGPVYELVLAKSGPKLKETRASAEYSPRLSMLGGPVEATAATLPFFTRLLTKGLARTVIDNTGLTGRYDFTLTFTPEPDQEGFGFARSNHDAPSIFTALREQLGLELKPARAPVETLIVDHAEKPDAN
jgi:uncharacterized protein (TIGR03435 family)